MLIKNFSRHDLNVDQKKALALAFVRIEFAPPEAPFFRDADHLRDSIDGNVSVVVAPGAMLLELWAESLERPMTAGTSIVVFSLDEAARKRSRFAATGVSIFEWVERDGRPQPACVYRAEITPTVENNFSDGAEFPYGTPRS